MPTTQRTRTRKPAEAVESRRTARRAQLLDATIRVIRRDGPDATMTAFAREAGVTKPILYRHFGHRQGLYQAVADHFVSSLTHEIRSALGQDAEPKDLLFTTLDAYLSFLERETDVARFLQRRVTPRSEVESALAGFRTRVAAELDRVFSERLAEAGLDTAGIEAWTHGIVGMVAAAGEWWLQTRTVSRAELVDTLGSLLWHGLSGVVRQVEEAEASLGSAWPGTRAEPEPQPEPVLTQPMI